MNKGNEIRIAHISLILSPRDFHRRICMEFPNWAKILYPRHRIFHRGLLIDFPRMRRRRVRLLTHKLQANYLLYILSFSAVRLC